MSVKLTPTSEELAEYLKYVKGCENFLVDPPGVTVECPPEAMGKGATEGVVELSKGETEVEGVDLLNLIRNQVQPGSFPASSVKADFLKGIAFSNYSINGITQQDAITLLQAMNGGKCVDVLIDLMDGTDKGLAELAAKALKTMAYIYDVDPVVSMAEDGNANAKAVLEAWKNLSCADHVTQYPESVEYEVIRYETDVPTDYLSSASQTASRPFAYHALYAFAYADEAVAKRLLAARKAGRKVLLVVTATFGTSSSRVTAAISAVFFCGDDDPSKYGYKMHGAFLANGYGPVFKKNLTEGLKSLCIELDGQTPPPDGAIATLRAYDGTLSWDGGQLTFDVSDQLAAINSGGTLLDYGKVLQKRVREATGAEVEDNSTKRPMTRTEKILAKKAGVNSVKPGDRVLVKVDAHFGQDATMPQALVESKLAGMQRFATKVVQSACHLMGAPLSGDIKTLGDLKKEVIVAGGIMLKKRIVHSLVGIFAALDWFVTASDSHLKSVAALGFAVGGGDAGFVMATGHLPVTVAEAFKVEFINTDQMPDGITEHDLAMSIPYYLKKAGMLTFKENGSTGESAINGKFVSIFGLSGIKSLKQLYKIGNYAKEYEAALVDFDLSEAACVADAKENVAIIEKMIATEEDPNGILPLLLEAAKQTVENPSLTKADPDAVYSGELIIDCATLEGPFIATHHNPIFIERMVDLSGTVVNDCFIGACVSTEVDFKIASAVAATIKKYQQFAVNKFYLVPPTKEIYDSLYNEGHIGKLLRHGAMCECGVCWICMGNSVKAPGPTLAGTITRNLKNRSVVKQKGEEAYITSSFLTTVIAVLGCVPTWDEYILIWNQLPAELQNMFA